MYKLCLATYLQIIYNAKSEDNNVTKVHFVGELLSLFTNEFDQGSTAMSKLFTGINNPTHSVTTRAAHFTENEYPEMVEDFRDIVMPMLNPNKIPDAIRMLEIAIVEDNSIKRTTIVDLITGLKKGELTGELEDPVSFLAGVFLYVIKYTKNPKKSGVVKSIMEYLEQIAPGYVFASDIERKRSTDNHNVKYEHRFYEAIEQEATAFCIKYDSLKELIPLCQIAQITHPTKNHYRGMFNDFCICTRSGRDKILELNEVEKINASGTNWWYKYLAMFEADYKKYKLGDNRYLYLFRQYFPKLIEYGSSSVRGYTKVFFPAKVIAPFMKAFPGIFRHDIAGFIDEYIYFRESQDYSKELEPPMDYLFRELKLDSCKELMLSTILALFIVGTCQGIPISDNCREVVFSGPSISSLETAEDLFYLTLLTLYDNYRIVELR